MTFFGELKRRNVFRMAVFYLVGAWVVLQVADVVVGVAGLPDWSLRLVGIVLLLGLPLVLVLSWVYQLTPEGLRKESSTDEQGRKVKVTPTQRLILFVSFAVVMVGGYLAIERFLVQQAAKDSQEVVQQAPRTEPVALALLPLQTEGNTPNESLQGEMQTLTGAIQELLMDFGDIRVVAPDRLTPAEGTDETATQLAEELLATHLFRVRARERDQAVWVNVELTDIETGERVWAYSVDSPVIENGRRNWEALGRLWFELGQALDERGLTEMGPKTDNLTAFEAWWRGRSGYRDDRWESGAPLEEQLRWFEEAIMLDPDYVTPLNDMAKAWFMETHRGTPWPEVREKAMSAGERALEIDPEDAHAHANMSRMLVLQAPFAGSQEAAEEMNAEALDHARKATALAPRNVSIREDYVRALFGVSDWDEVVNQLEIIIRYKPGESRYLERWMLGPLVWAGRVDEAEAYVKRLEEKYPDNDWTTGNGIFTIHLARGRYREALEALYPEMMTEPTVWVQDWIGALMNIGALDAVDRWGRHFAEFNEGEFINFVWEEVLESQRHLGRVESQLQLLEQVPDSLLHEPARQVYRLMALYETSITGPTDDPATQSAIENITAACNQWETESLSQRDYLLRNRGDLNSARRCFVLSVRTGAVRERLGDAIMAYFEAREPWAPPHENSRFGFDSEKLHLVLTLAAMDRVDEAMDAFRELASQNFYRPYHFRTEGVVPDLQNLYNGLGTEPEFLAVFNQLEARNEAIRADIEDNAPWLFDPTLTSPFLESRGLAPAEDRVSVIEFESAQSE